MSSYLNSARTSILDFLFPRTCVICGATKTVLCPRCEKALPLKADQKCPNCPKTTRSGEFCPEHSRGQVLAGVTVALPYRHPLVSTVIHAYKYRFVRDLAAPLGSKMAECLQRFDIPLPDIIVPVPLHPWRLRYRGFNQATLLALTLAKEALPRTTLPVFQNILLRRRFTLPQQMLRSADERRHNLKKAFVLNTDQSALIRDKTLWLVDDVATTGTTLTECARALHAGGARKIHALVLAH